MKSILKLQSGDSLPFVDYMPFQGLQTAAQSAGGKSSADSGSGNEMDKGLKALLDVATKIKGLPVDTAAMISSIKNMYSDATLFSNGQLSTEDLVNTYLAVLQQSNVVDFNMNAYKTAQDEVIKNGGLNEVAIDEQGLLFVMDKESGKAGKMSVEDYLNLNKDGNSRYQALSNHSLLQHRANDPQFAFQNSILQTVSNGIGMKQVTEMLLQVASGIGKDTLTREGYSEKVGNHIINGMGELQDAYAQGMTVEGLYKQGYTHSDSLNQINYALKYLWESLPENAKALLKYKSGGDAVKAYSLMADLMYSRNSSSSSFTMMSTKDPNATNGSGSGGNADKINPYISMQKQEGGTSGTFELNSGTNNSMFVEGTIYGSIQDKSWKPVGNASMTKVMEGGLSGIVQNMNGISFGDKVIAPEDLNNIMYDNGGGIMVTLPCKVVNGAKVVDLSVLDDYNKAYKEYKDLARTQGPSEALFGQLLQKYGLAELLDEHGLPAKGRFNQFLVVTGYGVDKNHKFFKSTDGGTNKYIEDVDTKDKALMELIARNLSTDQKQSNYQIDDKNWFEAESPDANWFTFDHVYKGSLYIPISNNEAQGHNAGGQEMPYSIMHQNEYEYQLWNKRQNAQTGAASLLNL